MDRRLEYFSSSSPGGWSWFDVGLAVFLVACFAGPFVVRRVRRIRGPVTPGSARVLSLRQFGSVAVNGPARTICRIRLSVSVPGREPYNVTVWRNIPPWELNGVLAGRTIAVEVDCGNPRRLRIGRSQPAQWRTGPGGAYAPAAASDRVVSAADLLASGQRAPGVLRSFAATGTTPRSLGRTPSRAELLDAPHYALEVEIQFPNLAPITARSVQPVPLSRVPDLAIGAKLPCVVDQADPARRFIVDWDEL